MGIGTRGRKQEDWVGAKLTAKGLGVWIKTGFLVFNIRILGSERGFWIVKNRFGVFIYWA